MEENSSPSERSEHGIVSTVGNYHYSIFLEPLLKHLFLKARGSQLILLVCLRQRNSGLLWTLFAAAFMSGRVHWETPKTLPESLFLACSFYAQTTLKWAVTKSIGARSRIWKMNFNSLPAEVENTEVCSNFPELPRSLGPRCWGSSLLETIHRYCLRFVSCHGSSLLLLSEDLTEGSKPFR